MSSLRAPPNQLSMAAQWNRFAGRDSAGLLDPECSSQPGGHLHCQSQQPRRCCDQHTRNLWPCVCLPRLPNNPESNKLRRWPSDLERHCHRDSPLQYQWFLNATNLLLDQTNAALVLPNAQGTNTGNYSVLIANSAGSITSSVARLTIVEADFGDAPEPGYPTTLANNGARHVLVSGVFLGARIDFEPDGQPSDSATVMIQPGQGTKMVSFLPVLYTLAKQKPFK